MAAAERANLSRALIATTALGLTDAEGLSGLSMRKLGAELGVEAMSLYHYVESKDDLLDAVLDLLYRKVELPREVPDDHWEEAVRRAMRALHQVLLDHPAALVLFSSRRAPSVSSLEVAHWAYRRFELVGLRPDECISAFRFAVSFVMGHSAYELGVMSLGQRSDESSETRTADPELQRFVGHLHSATPDDLFDVGVDLVIAGLRYRFDLP